jgi:hypothetical protein
VREKARQVGNGARKGRRQTPPEAKRPPGAVLLTLPRPAPGRAQTGMAAFSRVPDPVRFFGFSFFSHRRWISMSAGEATKMEE